MNALKNLSNSPLGLLLCLVLGGAAGVVATPAGVFAYFIGQLYLSVISMAAVPLLVVAIFFGLRQLLALPRPALRIGTMMAMAVTLVVLCAIGGTLTGVLAAPGKDLSDAAHAHLGQLVLQSTDDAGEARVEMFSSAAPDTAPSVGFGLDDIFPSNFYRVLAEGRSLGILMGAILFGLAFAALSREQTKMLSGIFEGIYRTLEVIIAHMNLLLPVLAFGMAAHLTANTERATLAAMSGFLLTFVLCALLLCGAAISVIASRAGVPFGRVLADLKMPMLIGLTSGSSTAPIPHTIEAMSSRLGFSRGVAELAVPFGAVFLRAGSALHFSLATVFVANLYDRPIGASEIVMIGVASVVAAFVSAGQNSAATAAYAGVALSMLQLPVEAAVVLFVTVDLICEGPRNLLSMLSVCTVVALVSAGLPSERARAMLDAQELPALRPVLQFAFSRAQLALAAGCATTAALLIVLMGIGVGAK